MNIGIDYLKPGMIVKENVYIGNLNGIPLLKADTVLNENIIFRLKKTGIDGVKIKTKVNENETIDDELRDIITKSLATCDVSDLNSVVTNAAKLVEKITQSQKFSYDLSRYLVSSSDTYEHCLNVASFACALAKAYNKTSLNSKINMSDMALAALLHEIGKGMKSENDLKKYALQHDYLNKDYFPGFSDDYFKKVDERAYPIYGYAMLKNNQQIPSASKVAILLQKENSSKSYPGPLKASIDFLNNNVAYKMSKIINICDTYENLLRLALKQGQSLSNVIEVMRVKAISNEIDLFLTELFFKEIPLYSVGTKVILKGTIRRSDQTEIDLNGKIATVTDINQDFPDRPEVRVDGFNVPIPLSRFKSLTIDKISPFDYSSCVYDGDLTYENIENNIRRR